MLPTFTRLTGEDLRWMDQLFAAFDAKDTERFLTFLEPDAQFRYGSNAPSIGIDAIRENIEGIFTAVDSVKHDLEQVWSQGHNVVCQGQGTYQRHDGRTLTLPFCIVFVMHERRIKDCIVYTDLSPLFAQ